MTTIRRNLLDRLVTEARARKLDADSAELERFAESFLAETLVEGDAVFDRSLEGQRDFASLMRDLRHELRREGGVL